MLTSSANQYLRPEYLTPLPTTLDAKKSPLALLAQTCSQIGADSPSKLLTPLDKKKESSRDKVSPASSVGSNISAGGAENAKPSLKDKESALEPNLIRTPKTTPSTPNGTPETSRSSMSPRSSPRRTPKPEKTVQSTPLARSVPSPPTKVPFTPSLDPVLKDAPLGTFKLGGFPLGLLPGYPPPVDLMTSPLLSPHALKAGLNPYLNYARMKGPDGLVCRDPYCTGCQLGQSKPPCPGGCVQCDHTKSSFLPTGAAAAAYAHAQLAALAAASQLPYVCNWIAGDTAYCGKRFSNSDELLQHLKTHTNGTDPGSPLMSSSTLPLLHRSYPTPPLSPLATARYHPYGKTPMLPPSLFPMHPHPSLPPYLSPYSLYGQRLGASSLHP